MLTDEARARWSDPLLVQPLFVSLFTLSLSLSLALSLSPSRSPVLSRASHDNSSFAALPTRLALRLFADLLRRGESGPPGD